MTKPVTTGGPGPPGASVIAQLERIELAARERRLTAQAVADRILVEAADTVAGIEAGVPARIDAALQALRDGYLQRADAEVSAIAAEIARGEATEEAASTPQFTAAVDLIVGAVLAERGE